MNDITLNPCQSLALRRAVDAMKADDTLYDACPDVVRSALCDFLMPHYSTAEKQIADLEKAREDDLLLLEKFGRKIQMLEAQLARRLPPPPY
jgi:hypothetical protein